MYGIIIECYIIDKYHCVLSHLFVYVENDFQRLITGKTPQSKDNYTERIKSRLYLSCFQEAAHIV